MTSVVLSLDLAAQTGWALQMSDGSIKSGSVKFPRGKRQGERLHHLHRFLVETKHRAGGDIDFLVWEHAFRQPGAANEIHHNMAGVVMNWCEHHQIGYAKVPVTTIKKFATGNGNAKKDQMVLAAEQLGYQVADDNEADALHMLLYVLHHNPDLEK